MPCLDGLGGGLSWGAPPLPPPATPLPPPILVELGWRRSLLPPAMPLPSPVLVGLGWRCPLPLPPPVPLPALVGLLLDDEVADRAHRSGDGDEEEDEGLSKS